MIIPTTTLLAVVRKHPMPPAKRLVVGLGLHVGVGCEEIKEAILITLKRFGLSFEECRNLAASETRQDEEGLLEFGRKHGLFIEFFTGRELQTIQPKLANPSKVVYELSGLYGVAEAAALLSAKADRLLVGKQKFPNVTVAIAVAEAE